MAEESNIGEKATTHTVLLPIAEASGASELVRFARGLIAPGGRTVVLGVVEVPESQNLSEAASLVQKQRRQLHAAIQGSRREEVDLQTTVRTARDAWAGIRQAAREERADLVVLRWRGLTRSDDRVFGTTIDEVVNNPPADIAVVKAADAGPIRRILLPVRGGPHAELALRLALSLAEAHDAIITVLRIDLVGPTLRRAIDIRSFDEFSRALPHSRRIVSLTVAAESVEEAILTEARSHDLIVMGASARPPGVTKFLFGEIPEAVAARAGVPVVVVKTREPIDPRQFEVPAEPVAVVVDRWFAENTFHSREFGNLDELVGLKRRQGLTISLGLPTLNEEQTIGPILKTLRQELIERAPLLDEIAVVDGGSIDRTPDIAAQLGVPVFRQADVLPEHGRGQGKGVAFWKSLHVLRGDILVWLATDVKNIHPRFVYGLVGPLLREPRIAYVKGFYRRPIRIGREFFDTGDTRLAELTVRPLINLFFPELSGVVEPLSVEHAGRRSVLERLPFFSGDGVLLGLLVDVLDTCGLPAIAQADLEERIHRTRDTAALGPAAFSLIQVAVKRLEGRQQARLLEEVNTTMKLIRYEADRFCLHLRDIREEELPPMIRLPEYSAALQGRGAGARGQGPGARHHVP